MYILLYTFLPLVFSTTDSSKSCSNKQDFSPSYQTYNFTLMSLPYPTNFLEPVLTSQMNYLHYNKHHQGYLDKLNSYISTHSEYKQKSLIELQYLARNDTFLQKHAGGLYNHNLYWWVMSNPDCTINPTGPLLNHIQDTWGNFKNFTDTFVNVSIEVFGSGWSWLCVKSDGTLAIVKTKNQVNPLMGGSFEEFCYPILGLDMWEHAYYMKYMWDKTNFAQEWQSLVDWELIEHFYRVYASRFKAVPV